MQDTAKQIAERIYSYYPEMLERKETNQLIKNVVEAKAKPFLEEIQENAKEPLNIEGFVLQHRKTSRFTIDETGFNEVLLDLGCLHEAKTIKKAQESRHLVIDQEDSFKRDDNLSIFRLPTSQYVRIHQSISKQEKEALSLIKAEHDAEQKEKLMNKEINELILLYKENKEALSTLEKKYEEDRQFLIDAMIAEEETKVYATETLNVSFSAIDNQPDYDYLQVMNATFEKLFLFSYFVKDSIVTCKDWYTGTTFSFSETFVHDQHTLYFNGSELFVDSVKTKPVQAESVEFIRPIDRKNILKNDEKLVAASLVISGTDLLLRCPTSSTKVEKLIDKNILTQEEFNRYRTIENDSKISVSFEMIEEKKNHDRRTFFYKKTMKRAQNFRQMQENAKSLQAEA